MKASYSYDSQNTGNLILTKPLKSKMFRVEQNKIGMSQAGSKINTGLKLLEFNETLISFRLSTNQISKEEIASTF